MARIRLRKEGTMHRRHLPVLVCVSLFLLAAPAVFGQGGHFEFSGHYGRWSLNILGDKAVELIDEATGDELRNAIEDKIRETYPNLISSQFMQVIDFDSSGDDFGASIRWYPAGRRGGFSLGVSVEKSTFKVLPTAEVQMSLEDWETSATAVFAGAAEANALIKATSFLLTLRWDILPTKVVHPYITFGGGISTSKALDDSSVSYTYSGQLTGPTIPAQTIQGGETKTLRELRDEALEDEENNFPIPNFIPFVQLNLGLKVRLAKSLNLFVDAGVLDGFLVRGGIAVRL
jgi:hypothetical protein